MELKPGYKQTEAGVIPEDWECKSLNLILIRGRLGGNYTNQDVETSYPLIKMGNIGRCRIDLSKVQYIPLSVIPDELDRLHSNDVLFNTRNTLDLVGKVAIWRNELPVAYYNSNLMRLDFKPDEISSNAFANYVLNSDRYIARLRTIATGTTSVAAIYTRDLLPLPFPVPPLPEQRAIAAALSDTDALLSSLDRLLAKKRDIKQAVMQQLLTGKQRLPGFSGEWEVKRLGNVGSFSKGRGLAKENINLTGRVPAVPYTAIYTDFSEVVRHSEIKQYTDPSVDHSLVKGPILLIASSSNLLENIGKATAYVDNLDVAVGGDIIIYKTVMDVRFLAYLLSTRPHRLKIRFLSQGSTIRHVYSSTFSSYELALPSLDEQIAIVAVLSDMDAEIDALTQRRDKTRALKQGMMQELLTGRTRLV